MIDKSSKESERAEEIWRFALERYARTGVEGLCLGLQDRYGFNVSLLLLLAWCACHDILLDNGDMESLIAISERFEADYLQGLRGIRLRAKPLGSPAFYESLKAAELQAERLLLRSLAENTPSRTVNNIGAAGLFTRYLSYYWNAKNLREQAGGEIQRLVAALC